jgi:5-methylcytosine-specific restriction endonuclease McrA
MPTAPKPPCSTPGCHHLRPCPVHRRKRAKTKRFSTTWRRASKQHLAENPVCEACGVAKSGHTDHVIPHRDGGNDGPGNRQALCASCHARKTNAEKRERISPGRARGRQPPVVLVTGAGNSAHVLEHMLPGEIVVDVDRLGVAFAGLEACQTPLGLLSTVFSARDGVLRALRRGEATTPRAWIVATAQDRRLIDGFTDAKVVDLDCCAGSCSCTYSAAVTLRAMSACQFPVRQPTPSEPCVQ